MFTLIFADHDQMPALLCVAGNVQKSTTWFLYIVPTCSYLLLRMFSPKRLLQWSDISFAKLGEAGETEDSRLESQDSESKVDQKDSKESKLQTLRQNLANTAKDVNELRQEVMDEVPEP